MRGFVAGLGVLSLVVAACSLNPQPLPPDNGGDSGLAEGLYGDASGGGGGSGGSGGNHLGVDSGGGKRDAGRRHPPGPDAGVDVAAFPPEAGGTDGGIEGGLDASGDAASDAPSDVETPDGESAAEAGAADASAD